MRWLALARYRYLTIIRQATGLFVTLTIVTALFVVFPINLALPNSVFEQYPVGQIERAAGMLFNLYFIHTIGLMSACLLAFGTSSRRATDRVTGDLFDTAPVSAGVRFWGDALGVFLASMAVHFCTVPLMALAFAATPWPVAVLIGLESFTMIGCLLAACTASWTLRGGSYRWSLTRALRSAALFAIAVLSILALTTDWRSLRDATARFFDHTDVSELREVFAACYDPAATIFLLVVLYIGFVTFYYLHSVRKMEEV